MGRVAPGDCSPGAPTSSTSTRIGLQVNRTAGSAAAGTKRDRRASRQGVPSSPHPALPLPALWRGALAHRSPAFLAFRRALLLGAIQVSPDKSVICRCTIWPFTCAVVWERLRDVVRTRLATPALHDVSVRSLAALVRMRPTAMSGRHLRTHSQASFPRLVTLPQLPSCRTLPIGAIIWYTDLLETPSLVHGTLTR